MYRSRVCLILLSLFVTLHTRAQPASVDSNTADNLIIHADQASTWADGQTNIVQLETGVTIELDKVKLTADKAVIWLIPTKGAIFEEQQAQIALIGNAVIDQPGQGQRSGERLLVTATVRGAVRVTANQRSVKNLDQSETYTAAKTLRPLPENATNEDIDSWLVGPATKPATQPTTRPSKRNPPISFSADKVESVNTSEGLVAIVITGNVKIFQRRGESETLEMQAERAVLFTPLHSLKELDKNDKFTKVEEAITAAYLEGDVRIVHTPSGKKPVDQRLAANTTYYDFETDRAVLTEAVIHSVEPQRGIPLVVRAQTIRQLSNGEYRAENVKLTQSSFYTPSYHIGMKSAYIRQVETGDPVLGNYTTFTGKSVTINSQGVPFFYFPTIGGSMTERGSTLRNIEIGSSSKFGFGTKLELGVFELLGRLPPADVDAALHLDYFNDRGPAFGLDGKYAGGFVTEQTRQAWAFDGQLETYFVQDHGVDELGRKRIDVEPDA